MALSLINPVRRIPCSHFVGYEVTGSPRAYLFGIRIPLWLFHYLRGTN